MSAALTVLHCDNHLLVVAKPAGLPTVPDDSGDESLLDLAKSWVKREFDKPGAVFLGVVHRLDRPVSGVVAFARTSKSASRLSDAFRARRVTKLYWGIVEGRPVDARGELELWLAKDAARNVVSVCDPHAPGVQLARTRWRLLRAERDLALLELEALTGRPHQLRVACRSLGAPLAGDLKYGASAPLPDQSLALHARRLELEHPTRPEHLAFEAEPPELAIWDLARRTMD